MEQWILKAENINSNMIEFFLTQYSNIPVFQYSNWGEATKFSFCFLSNRGVARYGAGWENGFII